MKDLLTLFDHLPITIAVYLSTDRTTDQYDI